MAASKFTPETRGALIERTAAGVSLVDACRDVGVRHPTVKAWLARGRKRKDGDEAYYEFEQAIERARQQARERPEPMDEAEHLQVVSKAARGGSVAAMKLRWEMILASRDDSEEEKPADPLEGVDELAKRRASRSA